MKSSLLPSILGNKTKTLPPLANQDSTSTSYSIEDDIASKHSEDSFEDFGSSDSWTFESAAPSEPEQAIDDIFDKFSELTDDLSEVRFVEYGEYVCYTHKIGLKESILSHTSSKLTFFLFPSFFRI